jgi:hypothetical protein
LSVYSYVLSSSLIYHLLFQTLPRIATSSSIWCCCILVPLKFCIVSNLIQIQMFCFAWSRLLFYLDVIFQFPFLSTFTLPQNLTDAPKDAPQPQVIP